MSVQVQTIYGRARTQLIDDGASPRWTNQELINWVCDGERAIVAVIPRASATIATIPLVAGARQTLPAGAYQLLSVNRNMGVNGVTPGNALVLVPREFMDTQYPTWPSAAQVLAPAAYMYDTADPLAFYVYQPADGTGHVEINYSMMPPDLVNPTDLITVQDLYQTALFDYVMFRAHGKDSDFAAGQQLAQSYFQSFAAFLANLGKDPRSMAEQQGNGQ